MEEHESIIDDLVANFPWKESSDIEGFEAHPQSVFANDLLDEMDRLLEEIKRIICPEHWESATGNFAVPIDLSSYPLLESSFSREWTEKSRMRFRDLAYAVAAGLADDMYRESLAHKINSDIFPITCEHKVRRVVAGLRLIDQFEVTAVVLSPSRNVWEDKTNELEHYAEIIISSEPNPSYQEVDQDVLHERMQRVRDKLDKEAGI